MHERKYLCYILGSLGKILARVISIANQKGGVGKTTTAVNLGASLAASEQRTLIIDCDPQGNTTSSLGFPKDPARRTLYQALILDEPIERITIDAQVDGLDLIPSDKNLVAANLELVELQNRVFRLREKLEAVAAVGAICHLHFGRICARMRRISSRRVRRRASKP